MSWSRWQIQLVFMGKLIIKQRIGQRSLIILKNFIIKFRMRKNVAQLDQYNLFKRPLRDIQSQPYSLNANQLAKNQKINFSTGNSGALIKRQNSKQQKSAKDLPSGDNVNRQKAKPEGQDEQTKASKEQSNISIRFNTVAQLQNEIQRISAQLTRKNEQIRHIYKNTEHKKAQIIELQKNVSYYEGRLSMMEDQLKIYENHFIVMGRQCDAQAKYQSYVEELVKMFEGMRKQNETLSGKYEQKCYQLNKLTEKYLRLKNKLKSDGFTRDKSRSDKKKSLDSQVKVVNRMSLQDRIYEPTSQDFERQTLIKEFTSKIETIEANMFQISKQNQRLFSQLEEKDEKIINLKRQFTEYKIQRRSSRSLKKSLRPSNSSSSKRSSREGSSLTVTKTEEQYQLNPYKSAHQTPNPLIQSVLRKLKYHLIAEEKGSEFLLDKLLKMDTKVEDLTRSPFNLSFQESELVINWVSQLEIIGKREIKQSGTSTQEQQRQILASRLKKKVHRFRSILAKHQYIMKIQIYNILVNWENELNQKIKLQKDLDFNSASKYFNQLGLDEEEIDIVLKGYYQKTGETQTIDLSIVQEIVLTWHKI